MTHSSAFTQITYLLWEIRRSTNNHTLRWLAVPFSLSVIVLIVYRLDRACYLLLGRSWSAIRFLFSPVAFLVGPWTGRNTCTINYKADIEQGLRVLHPELGVVVAAQTVAGKNLILAGGNIIGAKFKLKDGDIVIGNDVTFGVNSIALGPIRIGNRVKIGAGSVAVHDIPDLESQGGVPAKALRKRASAPPMRPHATETSHGANPLS